MFYVIRLLTGALMVFPTAIVKLMGWKSNRIVAGPYSNRNDAHAIAYPKPKQPIQRSRTER